MTLAEFERTLAQLKPPAGLAPALVALWWAGRHQVVMDEGDKECAWVHAYLHRVEGDLSNAGYWYRKAQRPVSTEPPPAEWAAIAQTLLAKGP